MKRLYISILVLFVALSFSCKKFIQQQEEKAAINIITNGKWYVEQYVQNDSDVTASFSGYLFKFDANGIVTGANDSVSEKGLWTPDIASKTISSTFPSANAPVSLLNGTWKIKDSYNDLVVASYTDTTLKTSNTLRLRKQ
jgi:hypothetical protein